MAELHDAELVHLAPGPVHALAAATHHRRQVTLRHAEFDAHAAGHRAAELARQTLHLPREALCERERLQLFEAPQHVAQALAVQAQQRVAQLVETVGQPLQVGLRDHKHGGVHVRDQVKVERPAVDQFDIAEPLARPDKLEREIPPVTQTRAEPHRTTGHTDPVRRHVAALRDRRAGRELAHPRAAEDRVTQRL